MTLKGKLVILLLIAVGAFFGLKQWGKDILPTGKTGDAPFTSGVVKAGDPDVMDVAVVTFGGYAGGQYFNNGFGWSKSSRFYKEYDHLKVNFCLNDNYEASLDAWKAGEIDVHWFTFDSFSPRAQALAPFDPIFFKQSDWSRNADKCVAIREIKNVSDLRGRTVAVAFATPSHSGLMDMCNAAQVRYDEITVMEVPDAIAAAEAFKAGRCDAAMVWSPDDEACLNSVVGSHVLWKSGDSPFAIADGFFCKRSYYETHQKEINALVEGWMRGAAEINTDPAAKAKAAKILAAGLGQPEDWCLKAINNVRLTTIGDNINTFNINGSYRGVTAEMLYTSTAERFRAIGLLKGSYPTWRSIFEPGPVRAAMANLSGPQHAAEPPIQFAQAGAEALTTPAFATARLSVRFASGSWTLDENAKALLDGYSETLRKFASMRVRVVGNTDITGNHEANVRLSWSRAKAVGDYYSQQYGFDSDRFVPDGKGPDNPVASNDTDEGRAKNRRTDIELIQR